MYHCATEKVVKHYVLSDTYKHEVRFPIFNGLRMVLKWFFPSKTPPHISFVMI